MSLTGTVPVFAEVTQMQLDQQSYMRGEYIGIFGKVDENSSGLVSIVIRDPNNDFVLLSQAIIRADNSFEKSFFVDEKFEISGEYNATAFILNMTEAKTQPFQILEYYLPSDKSVTSELKDTLDIKPKIDEEIFEPGVEYKPETTEQDFGLEKHEIQEPEVADFVDKNKDPQYYLNRYYNEPTYKSWFDRNYPELTIEEAVGYVENIQTQKPQASNIKPEFLPKAEASSIGSPSENFNNNSDLAHLGLAIGGLAILFGAVYGIKKKVNDKTMHISFNKDRIKKKIFAPIADSNPMDIIQRRLANGEISIEEYDKLKERLDKNSC